MDRTNRQRSTIIYFFIATLSSNNARLYELAHAPIGRLLWKYSIPSIIGMTASSLYNIIDRALIGQIVGPEAIAGLAITFPVMSLIQALGVLVGVGAASRISIALGQDKHETAERILGTALITLLILSSIFMIYFFIRIDSILKLFGGSDITIPYAKEFLIYISPGMFIFNLCFPFNNMMRASGYPHKAMWSMLISAAINIVLAALFIYVFKWGIKGAAIASDIAIIITTSYVLWHFISPKSEIHFRKAYMRISIPLACSIMVIGLSPFLINAASSAINAIVNITLYRYGGDSAIGAAGIFTTYTTLLVMLIIGLSQGFQPIVGYNFGAGQYHRLKSTFWITSAVATLICMFGSTAAYFLPYYIARFFTPDANLISATVNAFTIAIVMFPFVGFQIVSTNLFQSIGDAGKAIILSLSRQIIFLIPLLIILPQFFGLNGVWASYPTSDFFATIVAVILVIIQMREISHLQRSSLIKTPRKH